MTKRQQRAALIRQQAKNERDLERERDLVHQLIDRLGDYIRTFYADPSTGKVAAVLYGPTLACLSTASELRALLMQTEGFLDVQLIERTQAARRASYGLAFAKPHNREIAKSPNGQPRKLAG